jgi:hypothetical protein
MVEDRVVVPRARALGPPVGLVVAHDDGDGDVEQRGPPVRGLAEVVGRAEDDRVAGLGEPALVQLDDAQVLGELGRVDDAGRARGVALQPTPGVGIDHGGEAGLQVGVRVGEAGVVRVDEAGELDGLGLAGRGVAVELGDREAVVGQEHVGAGDAVPQRGGRQPQGALDRRQGEEVGEQRFVVGDDAADLVVDRGDLLADAVEVAQELGGQALGLGGEAGGAVVPRVAEDAAGDHGAGEPLVVGVGHASTAMDSAVAR